jgi:hypothetical protein
MLLPLVTAAQILQAMVLKLQMEDQQHYHFLLQLSQLAAVAVEQKEQMVQREQMVVAADIVIMLEHQALLEDSLAVMPMAMEVAEAVAQEAQEFQDQEVEMAEMEYQVQFPEP